MSETSTQYQVTPLSPNIGAVVEGVDLRTLPGDGIAEIKALLASHLVLFFRNQQLDAASLRTAACLFGEPTPYPFVDGIENFPEVVEVKKLPEEKQNFGGVWHSDTAYLDKPAMGALLYAVELPATGGDTLFSNMYLAWETLSPGMQEMLSGLNAVNDADKAEIAATRTDRQTSFKKGLTASHPVVRTHPVTGRKLLYVNRAHTTHFEGMSVEESRGLLEYLFQHQVHEEFTCRFTWAPGSVAFWDNRACQHYPLNDYHGHTRRMLRVSLAGDTPR